MSLPETIWWCDFHRVPDRYVGADPDNRQCWKRYMGNLGRCELVELRVAGRDDLVIRREDIDYEAAAELVAFRIGSVLQDGHEKQGACVMCRKDARDIVDAALAVAEGGETG